jgi:beta-lactam-binding protein with PASTA domain
MSPEQAKAELGKVNLLFTTTNGTSSSPDANTVLRQSPPAFTKAKPGTTVKFVIGTGPVYVIVPNDLVGKSYDEAAQELAAHKLSPTKQEIDGFQPKDTVLKVGAGITPGKQVQQGTPIPLQVSNNKLFKMPDLANLTPDEAVQRLAQEQWTSGLAGIDQLTTPTQELFLIGHVPSQVTKTAPDPTHPDQLVDTPPQTPAPGAVVSKSTRIKIVVYSKLKLLIPGNFVPDQTSTSEVVDTLLNEGFTNVTRAPNPPAATSAAVAFKFISLTPGATGQPIDFDTPIVVSGWGAVPPPPTTPKSTPKTKPTTPTTTPTTSTAGPPGGGVPTTTLPITTRPGR